MAGVAGLQSFNDYGTTTISDTCRNLCLKYRRAYPASSWNTAVSSPSYRALTVSIPANLINRPLFAVKTRGNDRITCVYQYKNPFNNMHYVVIAAWGNEPPQNTVELFAFDDTQPASDTYGAEVYSDDGTLMFNSGWPIMKVAQLIKLPESQPGFRDNPIITVPIANSRIADMAVAVTMHRDYYHGSPVGDGYSLAVGSRKAANAIQFSLVCYASESENFPGGGSVPFSGYLVNYPLTVLVVDTKDLPAAPYG